MNVRKLRLSRNPYHRKNKSARRRSRVRNIGVIDIVAANPRKRRRNYRRSHSRSNRRRNHRAMSRRNPFAFRRRHHRSHRNPEIAGFTVTQLMQLAAGGAVGVLGTKYVTQLALGSNNQGVVGYAGSAAVAIALAWAASKFAGREVATGVVVGGLSAIIVQVFQDNVGTSSMSGLRGLGDPDMVALGLGDYRLGTTPVPVEAYGAPPALPAVPVAKPRGRS